MSAVTVVTGPGWWFTRDDLMIACSEIIASALHSTAKPIFPGDIKPDLFEFHDQSVTVDLIILVKSTFENSSDQAYRHSMAILGFDKLLRGEIDFKLEFADDGNSSRPDGSALVKMPFADMTMDAAIDRARQRSKGHAFGNGLDPELDKDRWSESMADPDGFDMRG